MNLDKINKIKEWMSFANEDLYAAEHFLKTMEFPVYRLVGFNAQQSAEKYLKAYQIYNDLKIIKTHDLDILIGSLKEFDCDIDKFENASMVLTGFAVKFKYPDDFVDIKKEDAEKSIEIAKEIQKYITQKIVL